MWRQELFIVSLSKILNNLTKIQQTVTLSPTTSFLSSSLPAALLGPEATEVALPRQNGAAGLSKLSAASGLCKGR